ncbi:hypothetical protein XI07_05265 [Bradyrhizobium sp. CCBAU 11445]|nr:hypothetical protein [Bradyrhizobium sp. CCBAU 11445]
MEFVGDIRHQFASYAQCEGIVPNELGYEARITPSYLSKLDKNTYYVGIKIIGRLADTLDVEPAEFLKRSSRSIALQRAKCNVVIARSERLSSSTPSLGKVCARQRDPLVAS